MKTMWREHPDIDKPYDVEDLKKALADAVGDKAFAEQIFQNHIYGKETMPYDELLAHAGIPAREAAGRRRVDRRAAAQFRERTARRSRLRRCTVLPSTKPAWTAAIASRSSMANRSRASRI